MALDLEERIKYVDQVLDTNDNILTDIYIITNTITQKQYVGQSNTHRLHCGKYKPFGFKKRFRDHISEAINNTKKKQCSFLNNSIRKYGPDNFTVQLIERCLPTDANNREAYYIAQENTLFPKGYNLSTGGGKGCTLIEHRKKTMENTIKQYEESKLQKYENIKVDLSKIDEYIREYKSYGEIYYCVIIQNVKSIFVGKYMSKEELKKLATDFIYKIHERFCDTSKLREHP